MRISDWSSDVCSSDLDVEIEEIEGEVGNRAREGGGRSQRSEAAQEVKANAPDHREQQRERPCGHDVVDVQRVAGTRAARVDVVDQDRKSVVEGRSVSARVNPGGSLIIKKKTTK